MLNSNIQKEKSKHWCFTGEGNYPGPSGDCSALNPDDALRMIPTVVLERTIVTLDEHGAEKRVVLRLGPEGNDSIAMDDDSRMTLESAHDEEYERVG